MDTSRDGKDVSRDLSIFASPFIPGAKSFLITGVPGTETLESPELFLNLSLNPLHL